MSARIFKSDEHQNSFDKNGFIILPFITKEEIEVLNHLFDNLHPNANQGGFYSGSYSNDIDYKRKASDEIVKVFNRAYHQYFTNYSPFGAAFLYKVPGFGVDLPIHQDWTIVNEEEAVALNCWVPLQDIDEQNGALHIVPGTHYIKLKSLRSPTLPFFFSGHDELVLQAAVPMYVKAGEAVILNQSVIHGSASNRSQTIRKAITAGIKTQGAQMYFHYKVPEKDELEIFAMDDDFLISFKDFANDIGQRPYLGKSVGFIPYKSPQLEKEQLMQTIENISKQTDFPYTYKKDKKKFWTWVSEKLQRN